MNTKKSKVLAIGLALAATTAYAQYVGPSDTGAVSVSTVRDLLANGKDDQQVAVQGMIVKHNKSDKFQFSDGTGNMTVEIDKKYFPAGKPIDANTKVKLSGTFDKDLLESPKLDVKHLEIIQ